MQLIYNCMNKISRNISESLTYDDVLLVPSYSDILPREVNINSKFSKNISLNIPIVSAAMDTVTETKMAISMAQEGGIGVIHKNMSISSQSNKVRRVNNSFLKNSLLLLSKLKVANEEIISIFPKYFP